MKKTIKVKAINRMTVEINKDHITGFGTKLNDGTFLEVNIIGGLTIPIARDSVGEFLRELYPTEGGV